LTGSFCARIAFEAAAWSMLLTEYTQTFIAETAVMISQICVYKLAARFLGKEGFSEYAVARRTIALIYPIALLGLTVGLPRFIAHNKNKTALSDSEGHFGAALWCVLGTTGTVFGIANLLPARVAVLFFGSSEFASLVFPLSVMVAGLTLHTVTYAYFRGHLAMKRANTLQVVNLALLPPLVFMVQRGNVRTILLALGTLTFLSAGAAVVGFTPWQEMMAVQGRRVKELLRYGMQRLPGDMALLGLFTLPTTITAHAKGVQQAGLVAFGMLILSIVSAMVTPLGLILLPKASRMFATGASSELREHVLPLVKVMVFLTGSISIAVGILATSLIRIYLGPGFATAADVLRLVVLGIVPYCLFLLLSNVLDAYHRNSVTAAIEIIAFVVACLGCCVTWFTGRTVTGFLLAFLGAVFTLAILSTIACLRIFRDEIAPPENAGTGVATIGSVVREQSLHAD